MKNTSSFGVQIQQKSVRVKKYRFYKNYGQEFTI